MTRATTLYILAAVAAVVVYHATAQKTAMSPEPVCLASAAICAYTNGTVTGTCCATTFCCPVCDDDGPDDDGNDDDLNDDDGFDDDGDDDGDDDDASRCIPDVLTAADCPPCIPEAEEPEAAEAAEGPEGP